MYLYSEAMLAESPTPVRSSPEMKGRMPLLDALSPTRSPWRKSRTPHDDGKKSLVNALALDRLDADIPASIAEFFATLHSQSHTAGPLATSVVTCTELFDAVAANVKGDGDLLRALDMLTEMVATSHPTLVHGFLGAEAIVVCGRVTSPKLRAFSLCRVLCSSSSSKGPGIDSHPSRSTGTIGNFLAVGLPASGPPPWISAGFSQ